MSDLSNTDTDNAEKDDSLLGKSTKRYPNRESSPSDSFVGNEDGDRRYTLLDYYDLTIPLISGQSLQSLNVHSFLRTLLDFSLSHSLQLRALQKREIKLADLSLIRLDQFPVLVVKSIFPKTTQIQYSACIRHKLVELCPQFILAMYLFARFHIEDTFGELDLTPESINDYQFLDYKLLNGGKKLRPLSYSQQYKASTKILKFMDDFKPVNLGKILTSQYNNDSKLGCIHTSASMVKPLSSHLERLQVKSLCKMAGFDNTTSYKIKRGEREPPESVVRQIFPFLNDHDFHKPAPVNSFFLVLDHLRRSLVQDMVEIRQRFPANLLCDHKIFKSPEFIEYAGVTGSPNSDGQLKNLSESEQVSAPDLDLGSDGKESPMADTDDNSDDYSAGSKRRADSRITQKQNKRIKNLESVIERIYKQQQNLTSEVHQFIDVHAAQLASQNRSITNLINTTNGLSVLLTARSANGLNYARQVLHENATGLETLRSQIAGQRSEILKSKHSWK